MKTRVQVISLIAVIGVLLIGCPFFRDGGRRTRPFEMSDADIQLDWGITIFQEEPCGGGKMAGGETSGEATFGALGRLTLAMSSAWDIGNLLAEHEKQFEPESPAAAGPAAPVLGVNDYPHEFAYNPFTDACLSSSEDPATATGRIVLVATNGAELYGNVVGGETHRLDFVVEGDGIETFNIIEFAGGTGQFSGATGSFVVHSIIRFDHGAGEFVLDLTEVLPGGTIRH